MSEDGNGIEEVKEAEEQLVELEGQQAIRNEYFLDEEENGDAQNQ